MSPNHKGFLPHDGAFKNNYVLDSIVKRFKVKKHDLFLASLDISNAFGSFPHWVLFEPLLHAGAGEDFVQIIMDVYREALTAYNTTKGLSTTRVGATGVRQGDPLSEAFFIQFILNIIIYIKISSNLY